MFEMFSIVDLGSYEGHFGNFSMQLGNLIEYLGNLMMELGNLDDVVVYICNLVGRGKDIVELKGRFRMVKAFEH